MTFMHVVVSRQGFRNRASNPERYALLDRLVTVSARLKVRLIVLPAGFFAAEKEDDMLDIIAEVGSRASEASLAVIGGIDLDRATTKRASSSEHLVRAGNLPYFGFASGRVTLPEQGNYPWRQASITSADAEIVAETNIPGADRLIAIDDVTVGVLICGELFNKRARTVVGQLRPDLVVDIGHCSMGQGLIPAMKSAAGSSGCPVAHSQHLAGYRTQQIHMVNAQGQSESVRADTNPLEWSGSTWAAWTIREL